MKWMNCPLLMLIGICLTCAPGTWSVAAAQPSGTAPASLTSEHLDKLVAPIALYPDALILQIVQCAASPYQVKQVDAWVKSNPDLKGSALQDAASEQGFDASFVAIVLFPQVLGMMAGQPEWTASVGKAFGSQRDAVFASIQRLRAQAKSVGNLTTNEQQKVETVATASGQQVIVIQPANPQIVYVPQYDPQIVYVQSAPPSSSSASQSNSGQVLAAGLIGFAAGVIVGAAADDDDDHYYFACGGWGYHGPALCSDGWNDYYQHRENMANDYYEHRENMAKQRGENQSNRQDNRGENQSGRQDARGDRQGDRQNNRGGKSAETAAAPAERGRDQRATDRTPKATDQQRGSGAFSGYQRGETERQSSSRGRQSTSRSSGASRGGSGGASRSGGRSGGGRR